MGIEHFKVSISLKGNIIVVRNVGAFNEYGAQKYTNGVEAIVNDLPDVSFSILINNLDFLGATPEAYQELENYNVWLNQQKLIAKAMVITSNTTLDVINKLSPPRASQQTRSFDNEEDAMSWLQTLS